MLARPDYVEQTVAKVLLQRHKTTLAGIWQIAGIFLNYFMFLTFRDGVSGLLGVQ